MSKYFVLEDDFPREDFRYGKTGKYYNVPTIPRPYRKAPKQDRGDLRGKVCPGCGITRSMNNKCECNS
jgi:hypothetical protein